MQGGGGAGDAVPYIYIYIFFRPLLVGIFVRTFRTKGIFVFSPRFAKKLTACPAKAPEKWWVEEDKFPFGFRPMFFSGDMLVFGGVFHFPSIHSFNSYRSVV